MKKMRTATHTQMVLMTAAMLLTFHVCATAARSQTADSARAVVCIGTESISEQPIPEARRNAVADCLVNAVDQTVMDLYSEEDIVRQFKAVGPAVTENTDDLIEKYKILAEAVSGKFYRVILSATVSASKLKTRLSDLSPAEAETEQKPLPRLYVVMQEKIDVAPGTDDPDAYAPADDETPASRALEALIKRMQDNGYVTVGGESIIVTPDAPFIDVFSEAETFAAAANQGADLLILGEAVGRKSPNTMGSGVGSFNAAVTCRAVRLDSSETIGESVQSAAVVHSDDAAGMAEALAAAGALAGQDLSEKLAAAWEKGFKNPIRLIVGGRNFFGNFIMFRKTLHRIAGVGGLQMAEMKPDQAVVLANYKGEARELADALMLQSFESFSIAIREIAPDALRIELKPRE